MASEWQNEKKSEAVVLLKVLASDMSRGNNDFSMWPIEKINGETFKDFNTFCEKILTAKGQYITLEDKEGTKVIIDREEAKEKQKGILEKYNIEYDRSEDLRHNVKI